MFTSLYGQYKRWIRYQNQDKWKRKHYRITALQQLNLAPFGPLHGLQRHQVSLELIWVDGDLQSTPTPFLNQPVSPGTGSTCAITVFALQIVVERQI